MNAMTRWAAVACAAVGFGAAACDSDDGGGAGTTGGGADVTASGDTAAGDVAGGDTGAGATDGATTDGATTDGATTDGATTDGATTDGATTDGATTDGGAPDAQAAPITFATYNAGLAHGFVPYAAERLAPLTTAIAGIDADVVCLEEVWDLPDLQAILDGAKAAFPHQYNVITDDGGESGTEPACPPAEAEPLKECVDLNCTGTTDLAGCALGSCGTQFSATSPACQQCLAANIGSNDVVAIFKACAEGSSAYAYEGRNGLVLLSRVPLEQTDYTVLDSYLVRRAVLRARIDAGGPVDVLCTHLSAALDQVQYQGTYDSWIGEQEHQVDQLAAWAAAIPDAAPRTVLLGDMNAGPAIGATIDAESPTVYDKLVAAGFTSPMVEAEPPTCTWCGSNTLIDDASTDRIIDHVLLMGWGDVVTAASRIMTELVTIQSEGAPVDTNLSDHFGTRVVVGE